MTIEVRYVIFGPEEAQKAISSFLIARGYCTRPDDISAITPINDAEHPSVKVAFGGTKEPAIIESTYLVAALLLACRYSKIPIPRIAEKRIEISQNSFILVLTTDKSGIQSKPIFKDGKLTYGFAAAIYEVNDLKSQLARAAASAAYLENLSTETRNQLERAENTNTQLSAMLKAAQRSNARLSAILKNVTDMPGIRGIFGRGLLETDVS